jgi:hypothetical protein
MKLLECVKRITDEDPDPVPKQFSPVSEQVVFRSRIPSPQPCRIPKRTPSPPMIQQYEENRTKYHRRAESLDYTLYNNAFEACIVADCTDRMFYYFANNYAIPEKGTNHTNVTLLNRQMSNCTDLFYIACFWIIDKYCYDEWVSGRVLSKYAKVDLHLLNVAESTLLRVIKFDIRKFISA